MIMAESVSSVLAAWSNFYIMTGSSSASLTGLMFVVITLVSGVERLRKAPDGISAFSTPTVVHFCSALLVSAVLSAPWRSFGFAAALLGIIGLFGVVYIFRVALLARRLGTYTPDVEDWSWYTILPILAYGTVLGGAIALLAVPAGALFAVAAGVVLLIFVGIRNAWDIVTYIALALPKNASPLKPPEGE
jgi:hypothetical protein